VAKGKIFGLATKHGLEDVGKATCKTLLCTGSAVVSAHF